MKIGMMVPNYARWFRGDGIWATCEKGKELGLQSLCFVDHVVVTPRQRVGYGNGYMDEWTAMSYVAAVTNIQGWKPILTQAVCVIPYRPPIQQAKIAATVDSLSNGRLMIGAGSGYNENEFRTLGLNVKERGDLMDEYLACMKELWTSPAPSFHGKYVNFDEMTISVRPSAQPYPPILHGSHGPRPRRRTAERYQGMIQGPGNDAESRRKYEDDMADLNRLWKENGRSGKPFIMTLLMGHLTTDRSQLGGAVIRGLYREGESSATPFNERLQEGEERSYVSTYRYYHPDDVVNQLRMNEELGVDMTIVWLPSYRYGEFDNLGLQLQQMELLGEHVLPRVNRDDRPIEFDYDGKLQAPLNI